MGLTITYCKQSVLLTALLLTTGSNLNYSAEHLMQSWGLVALRVRKPGGRSLHAFTAPKFGSR